MGEMDPAQLAATAISIYILLLSGFATLAAIRAISADEQDQLAMRVFWSLTKTTLFLGLPMMLGFLGFMGSQMSPNSSGIMSGSTKFFPSAVNLNELYECWLELLYSDAAWSIL